MPELHNLFGGLPTTSTQEVVETILSKSGIRIERIVSHGCSSPQDFWFDQEQGEWVLLVQGAARLQFENEIIEMNPGDYINISANRRHRVAWTTPDEPTIWLAVHYDAQHS